MFELPYEILGCTWPRPVGQENGRWTSEPAWDAPLMQVRPQPRWELIGDELYWLVDWREWFKRGLALEAEPVGGEMRGFHLVFRLKVRRGGTLVFWDDDGCIIRRAGLVVHRDRGAHRLTRHELEVAEGDELEVAQWQSHGDWQWGARVRQGAGEAAPPTAEALAAYLPAVRERLQRPEGPPLKVYTSGALPARGVVAIYSLILNGYAPSKVILFGDYQWDARARQTFAAFLPFAEVVSTEQVMSRLQSVGGLRLCQLAANYWYVMKTFVGLLMPPTEFCLMDDDVFVLDHMRDALEAFEEHDLVYMPDTDHGESYLNAWGWIHGNTREPLRTATFNAGLYLMRNFSNPHEVARHALRVRPQSFTPFAWEQGYIANLYARRRTFQLSTQRYFYPLFDGLPGGPLGYDYAANPCGFASLHFGGLTVKPSDAATLHLMPQILGRGLKAALEDRTAVAF